MKTLVIGYGNGSRRDDGVGRRVVEEVAAMGLPGVDCHSAQQLEVELAAKLVDYAAVVFVDAARPESPHLIERRVVAPAFHSHAVAHYLAPEDVLAICRVLYAHQPRAVLFSIRGRDFDFGTTLSPEVEQAARQVVRDIAELVQAPRLGWQAGFAESPTARGSAD
jgi:hydrogenase maturation protease